MSDDTLVEIALDETREKMARAIEHVKNEFADGSHRSCDALTRGALKVDYFGTRCRSNSSRV